MYATVNKTGSRATLDEVADTEPPTAAMGCDADYAEVKCQPSPAYDVHQYTPQKRTKQRSQTVATVMVEPGTEDYSRLVHFTQPNPRFSMPLLSEYSHIGVKRHSLGMELDQDIGLPSKIQDMNSDYETMGDPPGIHTPPPLPPPLIDDEEMQPTSPQMLTASRALSQRQRNELNTETMVDPPRAESPPPLPSPILEGEESRDPLQRSQDLSSNADSSNGGKHAESGGIDFEVDGEENHFMKMANSNIQDGIYENIGKCAD